MPGGELLGALLPLGLNVGFKSKGFGCGDEDPHAIIRDALDPKSRPAKNPTNISAKSWQSTARMLGSDGTGSGDTYQLAV